MKTKTIITTILTLGLTVPAVQAGSHTENLVAESRGVVKAFFGQLKGELVGGIKAGGPAHAISVCNVKAAPIAMQLSKEKGMDVARTSLKLRNPNNKPDAWEEAVLKKFEERKAAGEDVKKMEFSEIVESDGKKVFRYMKAIPTAQKPCLACHGGKIKAEVAAVLDKLYPDDKARGYNAGDIRGAFTISKTLK